MRYVNHASGLLQPPLAFGPYKEEKRETFEEADASGYSWEVQGSGSKPSFWVDGGNERNANWMRYVNHASDKSQQSLEAVEFKGEIYYFLRRGVEKGEELLVSYGDDYGATLADQHRPKVHNTALRPPTPQGNSFAKICSHCAAGYSTDAFLEAHIRTCRRRPKEFACPKCTATFGRKNHNRNHLKTVHEPPAFKYSECEKAFTRGIHLERHMLVHTGEKPYKCQECNEAYSQLANLKTHILTHTGSRPYACSLCTAKFSDPAHLPRHIRKVHDSGKPITLCPECGYAFQQSISCQAYEAIPQPS